MVPGFLIVITADLSTGRERDLSRQPAGCQAPGMAGKGRGWGVLTKILAGEAPKAARVEDLQNFLVESENPSVASTFLYPP